MVGVVPESDNFCIEPPSLQVLELSVGDISMCTEFFHQFQMPMLHLFHSFCWSWSWIFLSGMITDNWHSTPFPPIFSHWCSGEISLILKAQLEPVSQATKKNLLLNHTRMREVPRKNSWETKKSKVQNHTYFLLFTQKLPKLPRRINI